MLTHDSPQCIETNAAMFADDLQCQKQNSRQLIYRYPTFQHAARGFHDIREARTFLKINLEIVQLCTWMFLQACMIDISVLYLACDSKVLILSDLLQHLLILTLLSFCLIDFSFQLLKPQILQTCSLLLSLLIKQHTHKHSYHLMMNYYD